jgi:ABC-type nitrate/sulfonate/bicarbonate transport system substrate-binding protein
MMVIANSDIRDIPMADAIATLQAQGYTVEVTQMVNGTLIADAMSRGDVELGSFNNQTIWTAVAKGLKAKTIMQRLSFPNLIVARTELKNCAELDGKGFAISAQTGLNPILIDLYLQRTCPGTKPQYVVLPDSGGRLAALTSGQVSAALMPLEEFLKVQQVAPGKYATLVDLTQEFPLLQVTGVHARSDWLAQDPEAAKDFIRAVLLAHRAAIANPSSLYDKVVDQTKVDRATAKTIVDAYIAVGAWDPNGVLTPEKVQYSLDFLKGINAVPAELKYDDIADLSYLDAVLQEIGRK